jgi:hypothetical protein
VSSVNGEKRCLLTKKEPRGNPDPERRSKYFGTAQQFTTMPCDMCLFICRALPSRSGCSCLEPGLKSPNFNDDEPLLKTVNNL